MPENNLLNTDFARQHPDSFARILSKGTAAEVTRVVKALPPEIAASVVSRLPSSRIRAMLSAGQRVGAQWLADAPIDDAITLLGHIPREHSLALVNSIADRNRRRKFLQHLQYPAHSLGSLVKDVPVRFAPDMPASEALAELRSTDSGFPGIVVIARPDGRYLGTLDIWGLLISATLSGPISDYMVQTPSLHPEVTVVSASEDRDWQTNSVLPVVDNKQHLLGAVTRASVRAAAAKSDVRTREMRKPLESLATDLIYLFSELLDWVLSKKTTS